MRKLEERLIDGRINELLKANNVLVERVRAARAGLKRIFEESEHSPTRDKAFFAMRESDPK